MRKRTNDVALKTERGPSGHAERAIIATPDVLRLLGSQVIAQINSAGRMPRRLPSIQEANRRRFVVDP
ncbi:MAG TPA: hypothetical protein VL486_07020 [Verrucomicrobiae bacterium]|nr:hypothetical protein [Verrucomicrobiae bacterium]